MDKQTMERIVTSNLNTLWNNKWVQSTEDGYDVTLDELTLRFILRGSELYFDSIVSASVTPSTDLILEVNSFNESMLALFLVRSAIRKVPELKHTLNKPISVFDQQDIFHLFFAKKKNLLHSKMLSLLASHPEEGDTFTFCGQNIFRVEAIRPVPEENYDRFYYQCRDLTMDVVIFGDNRFHWATSDNVREISDLFLPFSQRRSVVASGVHAQNKRVPRIENVPGQIVGKYRGKWLVKVDESHQHQVLSVKQKGQMVDTPFDIPWLLADEEKDIM